MQRFPFFLCHSAMRKHLIIPAILFFFLCSCYHQAYFVNAMNGLTNSYTTIPLQSDSIRSAFYFNNTVSYGNANHRGSDNIFALQTRFSRSHNFKELQAYYGAGLVLGNYILNRYDSLGSSNSVNYRILNDHAGNKFFGAACFNGGINGVISFPDGGEWRLGMETSLSREFGDYLSFRQQLPDSAATYIVRKSFFATLGGYTEIADKIENGSYSFRFGAGTVLGNDYHHIDPDKQFWTTDVRGYRYIHVTAQLTIKKWTGYLQSNFATKASSALFGVNYRLGK